MDKHDKDPVPPIIKLNGRPAVERPTDDKPRPRSPSEISDRLNRQAMGLSDQIEQPRQQSQHPALPIVEAARTATRTTLSDMEKVNLPEKLPEKKI